jgi:hypothetical protein
MPPSNVFWSNDEPHKDDVIKAVAHIYDPNSVVFYKRARGTEQDDTAVCRVVHHVVTDNCGTAADADTIGPLLVDIRPTRANVVVLNDDVITGENPPPQRGGRTNYAGHKSARVRLLGSNLGHPFQYLPHLRLEELLHEFH